MFYREDFILYNVLNKEMAFQEYFCNLLKYEEFRSLFLEFAKINNNLEVLYKNFTTEKILSNNYGRADLFLKLDEKLEFIFEIKNKCYTPLTQNQPDGYLKYLGNNINKLFFIIPKNYLYIEEIEKNFKSSDMIFNQILYWEDFIELLRDRKIFNINVEIEMFYEFCLYWFNLRTIKFTVEEKDLLMNKEIPILLEKIEETIDNIGRNCGMKVDNNTIGYNYSIEVNDYIIYLGTDYERWKKYDEPISISIGNKKDGFKEFELDLDIEMEVTLYEATNKIFRQVLYFVRLEKNIMDETNSNNFVEYIKNKIKELKEKLCKQ